MATYTGFENIKLLDECVYPFDFTDEQTVLNLCVDKCGPRYKDKYGEHTVAHSFQRIWVGMSAYSPTDFTEDSMGIVWEELDMATMLQDLVYPANNVYYGQFGFDWGITVYQPNIRKMLGPVASGTLYLYIKIYQDSRNEEEYLPHVDKQGITILPVAGDYYFYTPVTVSIVESDNIPTYVVRPSYTITDARTLELTNATNTIIKGISDVTINFTAQAVPGHSLESYTIRNGTNTDTYTWLTDYPNSTQISKTVTDVTNGTFYITISDTHGYTNNDFVQIPNIVEYYAPTCNLSVQAPSATGGNTRVEVDGRSFNGTFGSAGVSNNVQVQVRYKTKDAESWSNSWTSLDVTQYKDGTYYASTYVTGLDYNKPYNFEARIIDSFNTVYSNVVLVVSKPIFDWAEEDFNFNVPVRFQKEINILNGNVNMKGASILRYTGNDTNNVVLSASGGHIYLRPQGTTTTTGEVRITPQGTIYAPEVIVDGVQLSQVIAVLQDIGLL